jgi:hypothetical protein
VVQVFSSFPSHFLLIRVSCHHSPSPSFILAIATTLALPRTMRSRQFKNTV